jgi:hypothetical protein
MAGISAFEWFQLVCIDEFRKANPGAAVDYRAVADGCRNLWYNQMDASDKVRFYQMEQMKNELDEEQLKNELDEAKKKKKKKRAENTVKEEKTEKEEKKTKKKKEKDLNALEGNQTEKEEKKPKKKKKKKEKDLSAPKRNQTPFFLYLAEKREQVKAANPDFTNPEVVSELGRRWKLLPEEAKKRYNDRFLEEKQRYKEEKARYNQQEH